MSSARVLFFTDTHLGFDDPERTRITRRRRGRDFEAAFDAVLDAAEHADLLLHGGDVFHHPRVPARVVDRAYLRLMELADAGTPVCLIAGNHDRSALPPSLFLGHPDLHVFDRPGSRLLDLHGCRVAIGGFPFHREAGSRFPELLAATDLLAQPADYSLLLIHQAVAGAIVGPAAFTFRHERDTIRPADLPAADCCTAILGGHVHRPQVLRHNGRSPVFYPGSTQQTSFAERGETKGYLDIRLRDGQAHPSFEPLPTRTMVDLPVDASRSGTNLDAAILEAAAVIPRDAIVRVRFIHTGDALPAGRVSERHLRTLLPATMNVTVAGPLVPRQRIVVA